MEWIKKALGLTSNILSDLSSDEDTDEDYVENQACVGAGELPFNDTTEYGIEQGQTSSSVDNGNQVTETDAVVRSRNVIPTFVTGGINLTNVKQIEKALEQYEIASLVYLLYDNAHVALQELGIFLQNPDKEPIYSWALAESSKGNEKWQLALIEALCIIQNYEVLKRHGYSKAELTTRFLPRLVPSTVINISMFRKAIFIICDNMTQQETTAFLNNVQKSFQQKNLEFKHYSQECLELYFLYWETMNFVSPNNVDNIKQIFKVMEKETFYDMLQSIQPNKIPVQKPTATETFSEKPSISHIHHRKVSTGCDTHLQNSPGTPGTSMSLENMFLPSSVSRDNNVFSDDSADDGNRYVMDPDKPGIVLIINQEDFYTETDPKYMHLLPPSNAEYKLDVRTGTTKDKERLALLFKKFGFEVIVETNLHHEDLIHRITEVTAKVQNESSLFVCILSHGDQGVVYGANSCKVNVSDIQRIMCKTNKKLNGRPKVLLLQSCQGTECQKIEEENAAEPEPEMSQHMTTDGGGSSRLSVPDSADTVTFWATVPGYAAIRNKRTGSWFIQAFCKNVEENFHRNHLVDMCTRVINEVTSQKWILKNQINAMTPLMNVTFRKAFYFPPLKITDVDNNTDQFF